MDTTLANWTKMSSGCSSSFADAKFLGSTPIVFLSHSSVEIIHSQFFTLTQQQMECPKLKPQFLKKYKKCTTGSTNIDNVIENVIDFLYLLCTFESTKPGNKSTWFPGTFDEQKYKKYSG
jgi:hypothetical protein